DADRAGHPPGDGFLHHRVRTECLDKFVIFGQHHLHHLLKDSSTTIKPSDIIRASVASSSDRHRRRAMTTRRSAPCSAAPDSPDFSTSIIGRQREDVGTDFGISRVTAGLFTLSGGSLNEEGHV